MSEDTLKALLAHAYYSFEEVDWDFEQLTLREKCLIKNQEILDKIKVATIVHTAWG